MIRLPDDFISMSVAVAKLNRRMDAIVEAVEALIDLATKPEDEELEAVQGEDEILYRFEQYKDTMIFICDEAKAIVQIADTASSESIDQAFKKIGYEWLMLKDGAFVARKLNVQSE